MSQDAGLSVHGYHQDSPLAEFTAIPVGMARAEQSKRLATAQGRALFIRN
ncbi:hypothetical protein [Lysobacter enzymogenes]|nr:hypothetical protein [Lysobacter enzymogenes]